MAASTPLNDLRDKVRATIVADHARTVAMLPGDADNARLTLAFALAYAEPRTDYGDRENLARVAGMYAALRQVGILS